jgi:hypothetical protein
MCERNGGMMFGRKDSVRHRDEHRAGNTYQLGDEGALCRLATDMLQHRIARGDIEFVVAERKLFTGLDLPIGDLRKACLACSIALDWSVACSIALRRR